MSKHPHAENMALYAQDALETDKPWERWEFLSPDALIWRQVVGHPVWTGQNEYRRKPRTITINGYEVPEPVREPLLVGALYWHFDPIEANGLNDNTWNDEAFDAALLKNGFIHLDREAAKAHAEALLSFTKKGD